MSTIRMTSLWSILCSFVVAGVTWAGARPEDTLVPQSATLPAPSWVEMVDLGTENKALAGIRMPKGWKVDIVADAPTVINPVGMTFDDDGTLFVLEWPQAEKQAQKIEKLTYKDGTVRDLLTMKKSRNDIVKVLRDTNGDGVYDSFSEIIHDAELPSSILVHDGWVYLSGRGSVFRYKSSKNDGNYDVKEEILRGFCGYHHHQVSGLTIGPDGLLYITAGDNDNYGEGKDGSRVTVLRTGVIFRCKPDGTGLEEFAIGFRNPYRDLVFDDRYNLFHVDNDNEDGSKFMGCRLLHLVEGADFGWRLFEGAICCRPDYLRAAVNGELPGKLPFMLKTGRGAPAGLLMMTSNTFPKEYQGLALYPDVYRKVVRAYRFAPEGATFGVTEEFEFMQSSDPLFRPCQAVLGPDGAIYVVDWRTDSGGAGRLSGDSQHGRIYRIRWGGDGKTAALPTRPLTSRRDLLKSSNEKLLAALRGPDFSSRQAAHLELARRGENKALLAILSNPSEPIEARVHALVAQFPGWGSGSAEAVVGVCDDPSPDLRRLAAEILGRRAEKNNPAVITALEKLLHDKNPAVIRSAALGLAKVGGEKATGPILEALRADDGSDAYKRDGLVRAIEKIGPSAMTAVAAMLQSKNEADRAMAVDLFSRFRSRAAGDALGALVGKEGLPPADREALIRSYRNYQFDPPLNIEPMVKYVEGHPECGVGVQLAALEMIGLFAASKPAGASDFVGALADNLNPAVRMAAIRASGSLASPAIAAALGKGLISDRPKEERLESLRVIRDQKLSNLSDKVDELARQEKDLNLRLEALRTLAVIAPAKARELSIAWLTESDIELVREAVRQLGSKEADARFVAEEFLEERLPRDVLDTVAEVLRTYAEKDPTMGGLVTKVMKHGLLIRLDSAEIEKIERLIKEQGNPVAGRNLYVDSAKLQCITCHAMENQGPATPAGPALTRVWETHSLAKVLESVLEPSKEIKEGYGSYTLIDGDGAVWTGLLVARSEDSVTLRDVKGVDHKFARDEIDELKETKTSLMPEGVVANLDYKQFIDLVSFLKSREAQDGLRRYPGEWWIAGPFVGAVDKPFAPERQTDINKRIEPEQEESFRWKPSLPAVDGTVDFRRIYNRDSSVAYALAHIKSDREQVVSATVEASGPVRVWVDGQPVKEGPNVSIPLKAGLNRVLVKVATETGPHQFRFRLEPAEGISFVKPPAEDKK